MTDLISWPGYRHLIRSYGIKTSKIAESKMWGNGSYKRRNLETGRPVVGKVDPIMRFCFVMVIRESERHISGNKG